MRTEPSVGCQRMRLVLLMLFVAIGSTACGGRSLPGGAGKVPAQTSSDPDWVSYVNADYGFSFRYPPTLILKENEHVVMLIRGTLRIIVAFQRQDENVQPFSSGMPAGEFVRQRIVQFLGKGIDVNALIYKGKVKVLVYDADVEDLVFHVRLEDIAGLDYEAVEISEAVQDEADQIVSSFERIPSEQ